eukprot:365712-Chlamydomonas_euryale.AAC.10
METYLWIEPEVSDDAEVNAETANRADLKRIQQDSNLFGALGKVRWEGALGEGDAFFGLHQKRVSLLAPAPSPRSCLLPTAQFSAQLLELGLNDEGWRGRKHAPSDAGRHEHGDHIPSMLDGAASGPHSSRSCAAAGAAHASSSGTPELSAGRLVMEFGEDCSPRETRRHTTGTSR